MAQVNTEYLAIMQLDSNELYARRNEESSEGKLIRKEITRREKSTTGKATSLFTKVAEMAQCKLLQELGK